MYGIIYSLQINRKMFWVAALWVLLFESVITIELKDDGLNKPAAFTGFEGKLSDISEQVVRSSPRNDEIKSSAMALPLNKLINVQHTSTDGQQKVTSTLSQDNDYHTIDRAIDTLNGKMEVFMTFYVNEMSFVTTKLNHLKEKLNKLEILQHEVDQVISNQNTIAQKLHVIEESIFGSQSINSKVDRLELMMQQLHVRMDELMKQKQIQPAAAENVKRKIDNEDILSSDEQFTNCESKIEQLVAFVHSFAELNRLDSTDILNRLGNMQSQLIQFFDTKEKSATNQISQRNFNGTNEPNLIDSEQGTFSNITKVLKYATDSNSTDNVILETELNLSDDIKLLATNQTSISKRKRSTNWGNRCKRHYKNKESQNSELKNFNFKRVKRNKKGRTAQQIATSYFHYPKSDIVIESNASKNSKQVSAKYGQASQVGCHQFMNIDRPDEIHRFENANGISERLCSFDRNGSAWTVIQSRGHPSESQPDNFNRSWHDYKIGFGNLSEEFWYGNDLIHKLTYDDDMELKIVLDTWDDQHIEFDYEVFRVDSEENRYNLFIGGFKDGNKSLDAMAYHHNQDFKTYDRRNDQTGIDDEKACCTCAKSYASGWWFNNCMESNLNGIYRQNPRNNNYVGIIWEKWLGDYSMKVTKMMIRPKINWTGENTNDENQKKPPDDP